MYYVHVNKHIIASNLKHDMDAPAMRYQKGRTGKAHYGHAIKFKEGTLAYLEKPLPCGARVVISTPHEPEIIE